MSAFDYRLCDVCHTKVFYDAHLSYEKSAPDEPAFRIEGRYDSGLTLDHLGDWAVICMDCAKTHETIVRPRAGITVHGRTLVTPEELREDLDK